MKSICGRPDIAARNEQVEINLVAEARVIAKIGSQRKALESDCRDAMRAECLSEAMRFAEDVHSAFYVSPLTPAKSKSQRRGDPEGCIMFLKLPQEGQRQTAPIEPEQKFGACFALERR